jgi:hypothetical protein
MKTFLLAAAVAMTLGSVSVANATASIGSGPGFTPAVTIDFEQAAEGTVLGGYYSGLGVTFTNLNQTYGYTGSFPPDLSNGGAINFYPAEFPTNAVDFAIAFSSAQSDAAFALVTDNPATFSSYLGGVLVDTVTYVGGYNPGADFVQFLNSDFDSIQFTGSSVGDLGVLLDNLSFNVSGVVPEPATWTMMLVGFGALGAVARRRRSVRPQPLNGANIRARLSGPRPSYRARVNAAFGCG